jgi:uncharacterized protein YjbI with pentapeptide repeats
LKLPLTLGTFILIAFAASWKIQQNNVNEFQQEILQLEQNINALSGTLSQDQEIALQKDLASLVKDKITLQNAVYVSLIQLLGGAFFFVTAYFTWRNIKTAEASLKATEEKQITERFSKAIEHLGSEKLQIRLGGIYSLERIAKDSEKDQWQVIEVLTAFVRENYKIERNQKPFDVYDLYEIRDCQNYYDDDDLYDDVPDDFEMVVRTPNKNYVPSAPVEKQAVLTALGRIGKPRDRLGQNNFDFSRTDLRGVLLTGDLRNINFEGANLEWATLKNVALDDANFIGANLGAAKIENANLKNTNFSKAELRWTDWLDVNFERTNLEGVNLGNSIFKKVSLNHLNLSSINFREAKFSEVLFNHTNFQRANLYRSDLGVVNLQGVDFKFANLDRANLKGANLESAILENTSLNNANLEDANLESANLRESDLEQTVFRNACLSKADFRDATNLTMEQIKCAKCWSQATYSFDTSEELESSSEANE